MNSNPDNYKRERNAWFALTGQNPEVHRAPFTRVDAETIQAALQAGDNVTVGSVSEPLTRLIEMTYYDPAWNWTVVGNHGLVTKHDYTVVAMTPNAAGGFDV